MLKSVPFANAVAVVSAVFFVICTLLTYISPDLTGIFVQAWFHNFGLSSVKPIQLSLNLFLVGFISVALVSWVGAFVTVEVYNRFAKAK
ncbi:DUF5676 family membrane protein [Patescibacteria group bacterium]|nr:DUF5676 family membrane protein [Patescibacteria group bacterium]